MSPAAALAERLREQLRQALRESDQLQAEAADVWRRTGRCVACGEKLPPKKPGAAGRPRQTCDGACARERVNHRLRQERRS